MYVRIPSFVSCTFSLHSIGLFGCHKGDYATLLHLLRPTAWRSGEVVFIATAMAENAKDEVDYYKTNSAHTLYVNKNKVAGLNLEEETESILRTQASSDHVLTEEDKSLWSARQSLADSNQAGNGQTSEKSAPSGVQKKAGVEYPDASADVAPLDGGSASFADELP